MELPKIRRNPYIEIIPINTGCLNQCTYCKTKHARGDLGSYSIEEICTRVQNVLNEGVLEIWLTSEDTGAYGRDIGVNIVDLLDAIVDILEKNDKIMLRVGMTNPPYILEHLNGIARILNHPNVYSFLHVPVQSGSSKVLNDMRRLYDINEFEKVCDYLLENVVGMTLATDIICGFPTETEHDFQQTMSILEKYNFPVLHISQFYPRQGTPAARMKKIGTEIVKNRSRRATLYFESYMNYDVYIGKILDVLVTEISSDGVNYVGHTKSYIKVLIRNNPIIMGRWVKVEIVSASKWSLNGFVVDDCLKNLSLVEIRDRDMKDKDRVVRIDMKSVALWALKAFAGISTLFLPIRISTKIGIMIVIAAAPLNP